MGDERSRGMADRRLYPRYPLIMSGKGERLVPPLAASFHVNTTDISMGGIRLHLPPDAGKEVHANDILRLSFDDPAGGGTIALRTRVVWIRRAVVDQTAVDPGHPNILGEWTAGVEFSETPQSEIRRLFMPAERIWGDRG